MTEKNPLGPAGHQVRENVARMRAQRGMSKKTLSDCTRLAGREIPPLGISRIEAGTRRVDADDLAVLARVLGVQPALLLEDSEKLRIRGAGFRGMDLAEELSEVVQDAVDPLSDTDVAARIRTARRLMAQLALELDEIEDHLAHDAEVTQ